MMERTTETLAKFPLFRTLDAAAIARIDAACIWRRVAAGEWVLDYQASGTDLFFILRGHVRVVITAANREVILRDIRDGEFFGELAAIDRQPRSAGIVCVNDTVFARMSADLFKTLVHAHADLCDQVLGVLVAQIRTLANRANEHSALDAKQRLYAELLRLARPGAAGSAVVSPPPTHAELAARVSSHREAVTRQLNAMERASLIERRRGAIVLLDVVRLRAEIAEAAEG